MFHHWYEGLQSSVWQRLYVFSQFASDALRRLASLTLVRAMERARDDTDCNESDAELLTRLQRVDRELLEETRWQLPRPEVLVQHC